MRHTAFTSGPSPRDLVRRVLAILAVAAGYYVLALLGTVLTVPPFAFAVLWPATAFLAGCLLLTPIRGWWAYALALVPTHFLMLAQGGGEPTPLSLALVQIGGNLTMAAATALVVRGLGGGRARLGDFRGALAFIPMAGVATPALVSAVILAAQWLAGAPGDFALAWRQWLLAGIFPTLTIVPLMVLLADRSAWGEQKRPHASEIIALSALLVLLTWFAFGPASAGQFRPTLVLAPLPILLWAAARWGVEGSSLSLLLFAGTIIGRALHGSGPFAAAAPVVTVVSLQIYLTAISIPLILLAALMQDRRRDEARLRRSEARLQLIAAATDTGLWQWDADSGRLWMTDHCRAMFGLPEDPAQTPDVFLLAVHPEDRPRVQAAFRQAMASPGVAALDPLRVQRAGQAPRWFACGVHTELDSHGRPARVSGLFRDITLQRQAEEEAELLTRRLLTLQEDERRNIAEALHDTTTQHLVGANLVLSMVERRSNPGREVRSLIEDVRAAVTEAINELRAFTYILRLPELEEDGLRAVLRRYAKGFEMRTGVQTRARLTPEADRLPIEHQRALLRISQESLANVYRHAAATRAAVELRAHRGWLHLVVKDNGQGTLPAGVRPEGEVVRYGVGIPGMVARVRQLGGKIDIRFSPRGATVHVALPLPPAPPGEGLIPAKAGTQSR